MKRYKVSGRMLWLKRVSVGLIFVAFAMQGINLIERYSGAATFTAQAEAESGGLGGNSKKVTDVAASGGAAVNFGSSADNGGGGGGGGGKTGGCTAPSGLKESDLDPDPKVSGGPIAAWRHKLGDAAVIYYQTDGMPDAYAGYMRDAAVVWNASPCIDIRVVATCPASSNCVKSNFLPDTKEKFDGQFAWDDSRGYMASGTMTLVKSKVDKQSPTYLRMLIAHEMGHSVSLRHRKPVNDLMYYNSGENVPLKADTIALNNILSVYGKASAATTVPMTAGTIESQGELRTIR